MGIGNYVGQNGIDSFINFILKRTNSVYELLFKNNAYLFSNDDFMFYTEVYADIESSYKIAINYFPKIKNIILHNPLLKDDLFYYFATATNIIISLFDYLASYLENYLSLILEGKKQEFDFSVYKEYLNFIINLLNVITEFFDLKEQQLSGNIETSDYTTNYHLLEDKFEEFEKIFYQNYTENSKDDKKEDFIRTVINTESFKNAFN